MERVCLTHAKSLRTARLASLVRCSKTRSVRCRVARPLVAYRLNNPYAENGFYLVVVAAEQRDLSATDGRCVRLPSSLASIKASIGNGSGNATEPLVQASEAFQRLIVDVTVPAGEVSHGDAEVRVPTIVSVHVVRDARCSGDIGSQRTTRRTACRRCSADVDLTRISAKTRRIFNDDAALALCSAEDQRSATKPSECSNNLSNNRRRC